MFGILAHRNGTLGREVEITTGAEGDPSQTKSRLLSVGGSDSLQVWEEGSGCDTVLGAREVTALPPVPLSPVEGGAGLEVDFEEEREMDVFVGIMCRWGKNKFRLWTVWKV